MTVIPIVDLRGLFSAKKADRERVGVELAVACKSPGSFYIVNHGIAAEVITAAFAASQRFFDLPEETKLAIHARKCPPYRGYVRLQERKRGSGTLVADPAKGDFKENFDIGPGLPSDAPEVQPGNPFYGPNVWPASLPEFQRDLETYIDHLKGLSKRLIGALEFGLELRPDSLLGAFERPLTRMKVIHYPPAPSINGKVPEGVGAHTDFSCLTILAQDSVGGLEIYDRDGKTIPAPPVPASLFINVGDQLMRWTNDTLWSTVHRVVNQSMTDRYSIAFFVHPTFDAVLTASPEFLNGNPPKYQPVSAGQDLIDRLGGAYDKPESKVNQAGAF
ncbi:MAG: isopenicillin N synthase family oxygenase [Proteobacteria bacterium]|nr:isopenicillin N synthase family oxygenase [Pseudomonadota bacterium]